MWLLWLAACHGPGVTGEEGMVGRLLDASGMPIAGQKIQSIEAEARTDADGRFAVPWKPPSTHVYFERDGIVWHRSLRPDDAEQVELRLPLTGALSVHCPSEACQLDLEWRKGAGFKGVVALRCSPGETREIAATPIGVGEATCTVKGRPLDLVPAWGEGELRLEPPATPLRVEIRSTEGADPRECVVAIDGIAATAQGEGIWTGEQRGEAVVTAVCEGRPAWPVNAGAGVGSVGLDWNRSGPALDVTSVVPEARSIRVFRGEGPVLEVGLDETGTFELPPMPAGRYRVIVDVDAEGAVPESWPEAGKPGMLALTREGYGMWLGTVVLEADLATRRMAVSTL